MSLNNKDIIIEIKDILDKNKLDDLKRFLSKRQCLNTNNLYLNYLFHLVQTAGIFTTSYATGNNNINLIWVGIFLNMLATLISIYEQTNNSILKKIITDIKLIKDNNYIDEGDIIDTNTMNLSNNPLSSSSNLNDTSNTNNLNIKSDNLQNNTTITTPLLDK